MPSLPRAPLGVYVHFPWCLAKCPYCDFLSVPARREDVPHVAYATAVLGELERRLADLGPSTLTSVFFGGGTPSLWQERELGRVLEALLHAFARGEHAIAPDCEITVEANPSSLDGARARGLRALGVNRLSLGVQSLSDARLAFLGRLHDAKAGLGALDAALEVFPRVNADLIFGVAGETAEEAALEAATLASRGLRHVSAYALTIEPGTRFGARAAAGRLPLLGDATVAASFVAVREALGRAGLGQYEISNHATPGEESRHNLAVWRGEDYLGLGAGAWGTITRGAGERLRTRTTPSVEQYLATDWRRASLELAGPDAPLRERERIDAATGMRERLMLGLRLAEGFDVARAEAELGVSFWTQARRREAERLTSRAQLEHIGARLRIPAEAWFLADGIIARLL